MSAVIEIQDQQFEEDVVKSGWAVVDFYANWCPHCKAYRPNFEKAAAEHTGEVKFLAANVDNAGEAAGRLGIRSIPATVLLKDGEVKAVRTGVMAPQQLAEWLAEQMAG